MNAPSPPPQAAIFDLVLGFWSAGAVAAAARLGVPDALSKGPRTAEEIAPQLGVDASALYRLMRAVAGEPMFDKIFSMPAWQYYRDVNPEEGRMFAASMTALSDMETHAILGAYTFGDVKCVVDVAAVTADFLEPSCRTCPRRGACCSIRRRSWPVPNLPSSGLVLPRVSSSRQVISWRAFPVAEVPGGRVAIVEIPVVEGSPGRMTALLDLNMLLMLPGKKRTAEEYTALLDRAGLRMTGVTPTPSGIALIEGRAR